MTTLQNRMENSEFATIRELVPVFDEMSDEIEIDIRVVENAKKYAQTSKTSGKTKSFVSVARVLAIDNLLTDFPSAKFDSDKSAGEIRGIHSALLFRQQENEERERESYHRERRIDLLADSENSDFGIVYTEIDYAQRDANILAFGKMLESERFLKTEIHVDPKW